MSIRDELVGLNTKQRARHKALAVKQLFENLSTSERASFVWAGLTVQVLAGPDVVVDRDANVVGLRVRARAQDANGILPPGADVHRVVNLPIMVPDGTTTTVNDPITGAPREQPNMVERPIEALKIWLTESIKVNARANGWAG
jgi:hypothetical protein